MYGRVSNFFSFINAKTQRNKGAKNFFTRSTWRNWRGLLIVANLAPITPCPLCKKFKKPLRLCSFVSLR
ncbi:MAG: DUF3649 domain-containing protein [Verrucomicrobiales bacterium]|nr:DUF3649 domain-containing protein [Verrucomicrobiales bacterium]